MKPLLIRTAVLLSSSLFLVAGAAYGQEFPNKPIRIIVANAPGSQADLLPRIMSPELAKILGQSIVVENKPGANGVIAYEYVAKQVPPDGYTLTIGTVPTIASLTVTSKNLKFDPQKDLPPVMTLVTSRLYLMSPTSAPWTTYQEMIAYMKANPTKANHGMATVNAQLRTEGLLHSAGGLKVTHVNYKSTGAILQGMQTGDVHLGWLGYSNGVVPLANRGRVIAVTGEERHPQLKNSPTFKELGIQLAGADYMLNTPLGVPVVVINKIYAASAKALQNPDVRKQLANIELDIIADTPDAAAVRLAADINFYGNVAQTIGYKPN